MNFNVTKLKNIPLFSGIEESEIESLLQCLLAKVVTYEKNQFIYSEQDLVSKVGIVLTGSVHVIKEDLWGNRSILAVQGPLDMFAEAFICAGVKHLPVSICACEKSEILFIDYHKIITTCKSSCDFHTQLIENMMRILARKNIILTEKIEHITKRTTRDKLLSYFSLQAKMQGSSNFDIPFNRQELADYLTVDRSAMSNELCKMRDEGILKFNKNHFELHYE